MKLIKQLFILIIASALLISNVSTAFAKENKNLLPYDITYEDIGTRIEDFVEKNKDTTAGMG